MVHPRPSLSAGGGRHPSGVATCSKEFDVSLTTRPGGRRRIREFIGRLGGKDRGLAEATGWGTPSSSTEEVIYAVGDVHGRLDLLRRLEALITADLAQRQAKHSTLVMLGDYIDRGADSRGVIEHLSTRKSLCSEEIFLRGNHEQVLLDFLDDAAVLGSWCHFGGLETLYAYGLKPSLPLTPESQEELRLDLRRVPAAASPVIPKSHPPLLRDCDALLRPRRRQSKGQPRPADRGRPSLDP